MEATNDIKLWEEKNLTDQKKNLSLNDDNGNSTTTIKTEINSTKNELNDITKTSGIYKIVNKIDEKYYVGRTNKFDRRWRKHKKMLRKNKHVNDYLQNAWNKHGENNFDFIIVERLNENLLLEIEQKYLDIAKTEQDKCYNLNFDAMGGDLSKYSKNKVDTFNTMYVPTEETRQKIREARKHQVFTKESNEKRRVALLGPKNHNFGKHFSEKTRLKMSKNRTGKLKGISFTDEHKSKQSNSHRFNDSNIYHFLNTITTEEFIGTRFEFRTKYNVTFDIIKRLVRGICKITRKGWTLCFDVKHCRSTLTFGNPL